LKDKNIKTTIAKIFFVYDNSICQSWSNIFFRTTFANMCLSKKEKVKSIRDYHKVNEYFEGKSELTILKEMCQNLCDEVPSTKSQCRKLLKGVYINIYDYVDREYWRKVATIRQLRYRCKERGYFNRERAKSEGLRHLLKILFY